MSRQAIAAALARDELSAGERLVAFSLASFADRDERARPGYAGGGGESGVEAELVPRGARAARAPRPGGRGAGGDRARAGEHAVAAVRRGGPVVGRRDQRGAVRGGARLQPRPGRRAAAARRRWRRWPTSSGSSRASRRGSCAPRRGCRIRRTVGRGRCVAWLGRAGACAAGLAAGGSELLGDRGPASVVPARPRLWVGGEWRLLRASARCLRACRPRRRQRCRSALARKSTRSIRAARIGSSRR